MRTLGKALALTMLAAAGLAAPADAQISLAAGGGPTLPLGALSDGVDTGFNAQVSAALSVPLLPVGVRVDGTFNQFPHSVGDDNSRIMSVTANGILSIPSIGITPYLIGGLGFYRSSAGDASSTDVGVNIGAGLRVGLPGLPALFGEARLHNISTEGDATRFAPVTVGVRF